MYELHYQGEHIGWATITEHGCVLTCANEDLDSLTIHRIRGEVEWLVQNLQFVA